VFAGCASTANEGASNTDETQPTTGPVELVVDSDDAADTAADEPEEEPEQPAAEEPAAEEPAEEEPSDTVEETGPADCMATESQFVWDESYPPISEGDWVYGPDDAVMTILEYSEFQCPYCSLLEPVLIAFQEAYPDEVRLVFRHFPLDFHENAALAAQAVEAAGKQEYEKFFEFKNLLFENQAVWSAMTNDQFATWLSGQADGMGLDVEQFNKDLEDEAITEKINEMYLTGLEAGVSGTPTVLVNGTLYEGPRDFYVFELLLALIELEERQYDECPAMVIDPEKEYEATLVTSQGEVVLKLFAEQAPVAVNSFVFLAREGWFDGITFHRVIPGFVAQTGDPSATSAGGPGYAFGNEISADLLYDKPGMVGMANAGIPNSNGSQFFITYDALPQLDGGYTIFAEVISGMEVVESLTPIDPSQGGELAEPDIIEEVIIEEK
jgi:cyclophilin family peptidyl-prolyl cis-trans isomerase/protein-disulfide isomerase